MFFGIAVFAFEGNAVIQSLHNSMSEPEYFQPVLKILMAVIISVVVSVATVSYAVNFNNDKMNLGIWRQNSRHGYS